VEFLPSTNNVLELMGGCSRKHFVSLSALLAVIYFTLKPFGRPFAVSAIYSIYAVHALLMFSWPDQIIIRSTYRFLPRDATQSAVMPQ